VKLLSSVEREPLDSEDSETDDNYAKTQALADKQRAFEKRHSKPIDDEGGDYDGGGRLYNDDLSPQKKKPNTNNSSDDEEPPKAAGPSKPRAAPAGKTKPKSRPATKKKPVVDDDDDDNADDDNANNYDDADDDDDTDEAPPKAKAKPAANQPKPATRKASAGRPRTAKSGKPNTATNDDAPRAKASKRKGKGKGKGKQKAAGTSNSDASEGHTESDDEALVTVRLKKKTGSLSSDQRDEVASLYAQLEADVERLATLFGKDTGTIWRELGLGPQKNKEKGAWNI
jgi:hypothetical protein